MSGVPQSTLQAFVKQVYRATLLQARLLTSEHGQRQYVENVVRFTYRMNKREQDQAEVERLVQEGLRVVEFLERANAPVGAAEREFIATQASFHYDKLARARDAGGLRAALVGANAIDPVFPTTSRPGHATPVLTMQQAAAREAVAEHVAHRLNQHVMHEAWAQQPDGDGGGGDGGGDASGKA